MMTIAQGKELVLPDLTFEETGSTYNYRANCVRQTVGKE